MITIKQLEDFLTSQLQPQLFQDYCPNGLQVAGANNINKIITGVTANGELIDKAISLKADAIIVHHGFFWRGEEPNIVGIKHQRLKKLLQHEISLFAYHLPLDAHLEFGNNVRLAQILDLQIEGPLSPTEETIDKTTVGFKGKLKLPLTPQQFTEKLQQQLGQQPLSFIATTEKIKTIGWCSGAAASMVEAAAWHNLDAYLTGEASLPGYEIAREMGVNFFAAGHHATEKYGVKALGEKIARQFAIDHDFVDIATPV